MNTIESFIKGKKKDYTLCEDGLYIGESLVAVIDGVTAKSDILFYGQSSGCFAKNILLEYIKDHEATLSEMPAYSMYQTLNYIISTYTNEQDLCLEDYPRACMASYNENRRELSCYGDCQMMLGERVYRFDKEIDRINAEYRALILEYEIAGGKTKEELMHYDIGREYIRESLKRQYVFENRDGEYGFPTLDGLSFNKDMVFCINVNEGEEIVLATDGYPFLKSTLEGSEQALTELLDEDPLCMRIYKSTKGLIPGDYSFDDRTYWRGVAGNGNAT